MRLLPCGRGHLKLSRSLYQRMSSNSSEGSVKMSVISSGSVRKSSTISQAESVMLQKVKATVPQLDSSLHKGQCGRIAVFGGCTQYTGAPYFAAISALKTGADLVHVFCEAGAGTVIKGYSPELIVHPVLDHEYGMEEIDIWLPRMHAVVLGPGLGRNLGMSGRIKLILDKVRSLDIPLVLDADGLWHLATNPKMLKGYTRSVITPNAMEFSRLAKSVLGRDVTPSLTPDHSLVQEVARSLGHLTILHKGAPDIITNGRVVEECGAGGSPRRCGGQGDLLSGSLATFLHWANMSNDDEDWTIVAAWGAARLTRGCAEMTFRQLGRSSTTTDMISNIHIEFSRLYERETFF